MTARLASVLVVLAACGEKPGLYLEVTGDAAVTEVAVYLGKGACVDDNGAACAIAPPALGRLAASGGGTWFRDANTAFEAGASGGTARVRVEAAGPGETVQIIVLGKDQAGDVVASTVIRDVVVPTGRAMDVRATMRPTTDVTAAEESGALHPDGDYVLTWTSANAPTECVLAESWQGGAPTRTFIVPAEDADCDGVPTLDAAGQPNPLECDAYYFDFVPTNADASRADCATLDLVDGLHTCLLGGTACADGTGAGTTCVQVAPTTCLPSSVCSSACAQIDSPAPLSTCVPTATQATEIVCTFYVGDGGAPCTGFSAPTDGIVSIDGLFAGSARTCSDLAFSPTDALTGAMWQSMKLFAPAPSTAEIDITDRASGACTFAALWKDGSLAAGASPQHALADIRVDNDRHVWLPVRLVYLGCLASPTSELGFSCTYTQEAGDAVVNCAR